MDEGTEQLFVIAAGPDGERPTTAQIDETVELLCQRMQALGVGASIEKGQTDPPHLRVVLPKLDQETSYRASSLLSSPGRVHFYEWEANIVPNPAAPADRAADTPFTRIDQALRFAAQQKPECFQDSCTTGASTYWALLKEEPERATELGVASSKQQAIASLPPKVRADYEVLAVPQGTLVVYMEPPQGAPQGWYVVRDRPALSDDEIANPMERPDPITSEPSLTFEFTPRGQRAFEELTRAIAEAGIRSAPGRVIPPASEAAELSRSFAIILDEEVASRPLVNFAESPAGLDARKGVTLQGPVGDKQIGDLAIVLQSGPLPVRLNPVVALP